MDSGSESSVDFKPFFDMIVGVMFILLILVAAQMFFTQWTPENSQEQAAQQRKAMLVREADGFLDALAARLQAVGFEAAVDRTNRTLSIPAGKLLRRVDAPAGGFSVERDNVSRFAAALHGELVCISVGGERPGTCKSFSLLSLSGMATKLALEQEAVGATPAPNLRIAALDLAAALFVSRPELLQLAIQGGSPALRTAIDVSTVAQPVPLAGNVPAGRVELWFSFADLVP
jgi:hypothetical protein